VKQVRIFAKEDFRSRRIRMGFTCESIAALTGYTTSAFSKVERRENGINPKRAKKVLEALQLDFDEVFELVEEKTI
jgi:transcriptional regulator with XRE-family HTH domain